MAYSTPSPSDSAWSSTLSDCDNAQTGHSTGWGGNGIELFATPPMASATIASLQSSSVTSAPKAHTMSPTPSPTSPTCTVMSAASAPTAPPKVYAKEDDWIRYRARIIDIYLTQDKKLITTMETMEEKYNFVATGRMYKARFKEWGCGKNITAAAVYALVAKIRAGVELDVREVIRVLKYIRRKPAALKKMRADPTRPLDVLKGLSVVNGKICMASRTKVSLPAAKTEDQQPHTPLPLTSPPSDLPMPWSPREGAMAMDGRLDEMTRLVLTAVQDFNLASSPMPLTPTHWQTLNPGSNQLMDSAMPVAVENLQVPHQMMLDFVLKLRVAHILLEDGYTAQAYEVGNLCMSILTTMVHQTQGLDTRASGTVILYALTAALEMSINLSDQGVLRMLFQHINDLCGEQLPRMAEIARRIPQLSPMLQISVLKLARMEMSRTTVGYYGRDNPSYEVYSKTVDITISNESPQEKLWQLQAYQLTPLVQSMPQMVVWMEERISLAVAELFSQGLKTSAAIRHSIDQTVWHKMVGNWAVVERRASDWAWWADLVYDPEDELWRKLRAEIESVRSPMLAHSPHTYAKVDGEMTPVSAPMSVCLPPMHTLHASMALPETRGFGQQMQHPGSSPIWAQVQGRFHDTTLPSLWTNVTGGTTDGLSGVDSYDTSPSS